MYQFKKIIGKLRAGVVGFAVILSSMTAVPLEAASNTATQDASRPFRILGPTEMMKEMGAGWNLGNTMDGHTGFTPGETQWQSTVTTKELLRAVHDLGFNTVRVPVTWGTMIDDGNGYKINEEWLSRVQDIADYAIAQDMYVIVNIHHDGAEQMGWLRVASEDVEGVNHKFEAVWKQIAERFKDYDEHLIFESMNEVKGEQDTQEGTIADIKRIMELNQIFVDAIRSAGGNNKERWLAVPARYTNMEVTTNSKYGFELPKDTVKNRLFISVHYYDWTFGLVESMARTTFSYENAAALQKDFQKMLNRFWSKGIPTILGEYGCMNKNNSVERAYHMEIVTRLASTSGMVACAWDIGWYDRSRDPDYSFTLVDRGTGETLDKAVTDAVMRGTFLKPQSKDLSDITKELQLIAITDFSVSTDQCVLSLNDSIQIETNAVPENTNDIVLWKTDNPNVATVYNGMIRGRGIGSTAITAYTQNGSMEKTINVIVKALQAENPVTEINVEDPASIGIGESFYLNASIAVQDEEHFLTYHSSNEAVASVSSVGKVVGKKAGTAYMVLTASTGLTKVVKVVVTEAAQNKEFQLSLNVYYNDSNAGYFSNESGQPITIKEAGTYTVQFDCTKDLSETAKALGVDTLTNLTAIYIKDDAVTKGQAKKSPLISCDITYDNIVIDGVALTIGQGEGKSAIKSSGIFDTNDPINSWDGSVVQEITVKDHVLNFEGIQNPKRAEVTFTLSNLVFEGEESESKTAIKSLVLEKGNQGETITLTEEKTATPVRFKAEPGGSSMLVAFVSEDSSVVAADSAGVAVDGDGFVTVNLMPLSNGTATIRAIAENGLEATAQVTVELSKEAEPKEAESRETESDKAIDVEDSAQQEEEYTNQEKQGGLNTTSIVIIIASAMVILLSGAVILRELRKR